MPASAPTVPGPAPVDDLFAGGGEMGRRMRAYDWSSHPLGPPEQWPPSLRTVIRILLTSRYAMWLGWGPEFWFFCNDAYRPTLGLKEHRALGASARKVWAEIWNVVGIRAESVVATGQATWDEGLRLFLERSGYPEETYHTFSYSPVPDGHGGNGGMLCVVTEETERVIGQRRLALLGELASALARTRSESDLFAAQQRVFAGRPEDLPFALVYLFESETSTAARLACAHGIEAGHPLAPANLPAEAASPWPVARVLRQEGSRVLELATDPEPPRGTWDRPPAQAALVPLAQSGHARPAGFLVVGLNPYRPFDDAYRGFLELLAGQVSAGLGSARAYDAERRRAAALAELDRAKTEFFSNVSHEFRTPLTLMLAPLEDELRERPDRRERLETVHRNSLRLLKLVNTLLEFSRLEAGRINAHYVPTELGAFTAELASSFRSVIERAGLAYDVDCPPQAELVHVDREMWEKIVFNLLSNAFKFTFHGTISVALRARGSWVELSVADTGTGIPAAEQPRLFERFHRVQGAHSRSHEGTGIGLALTSELVRLHGGEVGVESREGHGTTFRVRLRTGTAHLPPDRVGHETPAPTLPVAAAFLEEAARWETGTGAPPPSPAVAGERRARLLLAEDNADMRDYVRRLLAPHYDVTAVGDGRAALDTARREAPDLLLTDVMMPRLDGFGLLREWRADPALQSVPVIVLSARAGEESRIEGLEHGADDYLVKPFTARELLARIHTHLDLARIRREAARRVHDSEARFRHVADHSPLMFWVTEADGHCVYLNQRWYEFTGQTAEQALGHGWLDAVHPDDRAEAGREFEAANRSHSAFRLEYRLRRYDGVYRWMVDAAAPRFIEGRFLGFVGSVLDITDEREQFEEITRNRSQLQLALEAGRTGTFDWDMPAGRVHWSPELEKLYGLTEGAFERTFRAWTDRVVPEDVARVETLLQECFAARREDARYEFRVVLPDGNHRWMEGKAKFFYGPHGQPRRMVGINVDIDERKRAELNLQFLNALTQEVALLADPGEIMAAVVRGVGTHLKSDLAYFFTADAARDAARIERKWTRDEAATAPAVDEGHELAVSELWRGTAATASCVANVAEAPLDADAAYACAARGVRAWAVAPFHRENRWVASLAVATAQPRRWTASDLGLLENVIARVWPLVERARSEQAVAEAEMKIRASEERLRTAIEAAQLGTWDIKPKTGELTWDARSRELFGGFPAGSPDYHDAIAVLHPDDRTRIANAVLRALDPRGDGRYDEEFRTVAPDGTARWVRASGRAVFEHGEAVRFSGTMLDVTPLVQARETLAERRKELERLVDERTTALRDTVAELEGFSYSISHDLRAPLRAMQSFAQLLAEECGPQVTEAGRDYLRRIINASNRMDRLIHDVLLYSQVARTELRLEPVDLHALVRGIVESYPQFQAPAVEIVIGPTLPPVLGNEAAITQCISNLLGNAVKFVARGTRPRVEITGERRDGRVLLCVKDNGIGIDPAAHDRIFGIFERLGRDYEGTGIGLAVVRKAAERMGGSISVRSTPGQGSTFCLNLAAAP